LVVYCLLMCSHLRCHDLSVVPWTATLMVLWPFLRLMASMAAARRDCFSRSMVSKRLVWTAESGTMFQTMTPAFYINIPPLYGNPYGVPGLRCLQAPGGRWSVPASGCAVDAVLRKIQTETTGIGKDCYFRATAMLHTELAHTFGRKVGDSFLEAGEFGQAGVRGKLIRNRSSATGSG